ncbi:MAG: DMT family transporter [Anaerolineales bacterium]|nr:DMT family transporter [Anaerolineales bacterium]
MSTHLSQTRTGLQTRRQFGTQFYIYALFGGAMAIAFAPIFVRLSQVGPGATAFWRLALALPAVWIWMSLERRGDATAYKPTSRFDYLQLALAGVFFALDLLIWHWALKFTSVANATLFPNFAPIFVALGGRLIFKQRVGLGFVGGMALALVGVVFLVGENFSLHSQHLLGDLLGLLTAVFYAGYILAVKTLRDRFSTATIMAWSGATTTLLLLPVTLISGEALFPPEISGWLVLLGLALLSQVFGQGAIAFALARLPAAFSSVGLLFQPVMSTMLAWLFLGEALGRWQMIGGVLALAGIFVARRTSNSD